MKINTSPLFKSISLPEEKIKYEPDDISLKELYREWNIKLIKNIGFGGFSTVKLAYNDLTDKYYACKIVNIKNEKFKRKTKEHIEKTILNEIQMGEILKNEFLVDMLNIIKINDNYYFLMENIEFGNLKSFMENEINNNCSELLCSYFINQCLLGLYYMHSRLIVHRDIKLENILVNKNYKIKIADFSMCSQLKPNNKYLISRSGTIGFLPPECFVEIAGSKKKLLSTEASLKKDIFALGVSMYKLLFKEHPFNYEYRMSKEEYILNFYKVKPKYNLKYITNDCKEFLKGLLMLDVYKRFDVNEALKHNWIIKTQNIIKSIMKKNKSKENFDLIKELNNFIMDEDFEYVKDKKIVSEYSSTKESEDKELLKHKRKRERDLSCMDEEK